MEKSGKGENFSAFVRNLVDEPLTEHVEIYQLGQDSNVVLEIKTQN